MNSIPINYYILLSTLLFSIGVLGVLFRRNAIIIFMCIELMLNAVNLLLAAFSTYLSDPAGQIFVFFIMAVAAAEVAVGLAILTMIFRNTGSVDIDSLNKLKWWSYVQGAVFRVQWVSLQFAIGQLVSRQLGGGRFFVDGVRLNDCLVWDRDK